MNNVSIFMSNNNPAGVHISVIISKSELSFLLGWGSYQPRGYSKGTAL